METPMKSEFSAETIRYCERARPSASKGLELAASICLRIIRRCLISGDIEGARRFGWGTRIQPPVQRRESIGI